jgi:outer membrane receptor for monomeric catechols
MCNASNFVTIDLNELMNVSGGDAWDDYKKKVGDDAKATADRWNEAGKWTYHNGNNPGKFVDNYVGALFNGAKTGWDATGGALFDAVGLLK